MRRLVQRGNKIGDFVFCGAINVCKTSVFELLKENFKELKGVDLRYNKTQKEPKARNIKRLKWLPKEEIPLTAFYSLISFDSLPQNTVERDERGIVNLSGIAEIRGGIVIPREQGNELFFSSNLVSNYDFFSLKNSAFLLCTERVKDFCENNNFKNVVFLEMGDIV